MSYPLLDLLDDLERERDDIFNELEQYSVKSPEGAVRASADEEEDDDDDGHANGGLTFDAELQQQEHSPRGLLRLVQLGSQESALIPAVAAPVFHPPAPAPTPEPAEAPSPSPAPAPASVPDAANTSTQQPAASASPTPGGPALPACALLHLDAIRCRLYPATTQPADFPPPSSSSSSSAPSSSSSSSFFDEGGAHSAAAHMTMTWSLLDNTIDLRAPSQSSSPSLGTLSGALSGVVSAAGGAERGGGGAKGGEDVFIGRRRIELGPWDRASSTLIRPDVSDSAVLGLVAQVLLSAGGVVTGGAERWEGEGGEGEGVGGDMGIGNGGNRREGGEGVSDAGAMGAGTGGERAGQGAEGVGDGEGGVLEVAPSPSCPWRFLRCYLGCNQDRWVYVFVYMCACIY